MPQGQRVLVVDDEPAIAESLVRILTLKGFEAVAVHSGEEATAIAATFRPDIAILDVILGGLNGIDAADLIVKQLPACKIVLFSGHPDTAGLFEKAASTGVQFPLFAKPLDPEILLAHLGQAAGTPFFAELPGPES